VSFAERIVVRRGSRHRIEDVVGVASDAVAELGK
jgi:hypothetical protein